MKRITFDSTISHFKSLLKDLPDPRTGSNRTYTMTDAVLGAFSVFVTQSPSFLSFQKAMQKKKGKNNARSLFGVAHIPSDNQIKNLLDPISPSHFFPMFSDIFHGLNDAGLIEAFRSYNGNLLIALDGTQYFSSKSIHCANCNQKQHKNGSITYYHTAITPVIVAPGNNNVISLQPEFITPQDGHKKQDCENAAAKRWTGKRHEIDTYRFMNGVPLKDAKNALAVNWCELTTTLSNGDIIYKNAFATNFKISKDNVEKIVADGRARWKIENENNNVLKNRGYHLTHNYGHGDKHLSSVLLTLNLLAFLFHTILYKVDAKYKMIRDNLPARQTFFDDIRALTRYMCFDCWKNLMDFMLRGLELEPP